MGRKVCLAFLAPLATDYKVLKGSKDLKASRGQRARQAVASLVRRESMENGATWERKEIKGKLEIPDLKENRGYQDQKET